MNKILVNFLNVLLLILVCPFTTIAYSQQTSQTINYNVKVGDSITYDVITTKTSQENYVNTAMILENGKTSSYKQTAGDKVYIDVVNINQSRTGIEQVFVKTIVGL